MPDFTTTSGQYVNSPISLSPINDPAKGRSVSIDDSRYSILGEHIMPATFDFASLQTAETKQVAADFAAYQSLLREIAGGRCKRSKPEILAILKSVDRDSKLLQEDVKKRVERDEAIKEVGRLDEYKAEYKKTDKELDVMIAEFEKVEREFEDKKWPLLYKRNSYSDKIRAIDGLRRKLAAECEDSTLILERECLENQLDDPAEAKLYEKQRELGDEIGTLETALMKLPIRMNHSEEKRALLARITELRAKHEVGEQQKLEFDRRKNEVKKAIAEVESRMAFA